MLIRASRSFFREGLQNIVFLYHQAKLYIPEIDQMQTGTRSKSRSAFCSSGTSLHKTESIGVLHYRWTRQLGNSHIPDRERVGPWELLTDTETQWYWCLMSRQEARVDVCLSLRRYFQHRGKWRHTCGGVTQRKVFRRWVKTSGSASPIAFILRVSYWV